MKKRVLHVINSMSPGGAEILVANALSPGGLNENTENHLAYFTTPSYLLDQLDAGVKIHDLKYKGITDLVAVLSRIRRIIKQNKIQIVHSHLSPAGLYSYLATPHGVHHVHTIHTAYSMDTVTPKSKLLLEKYFFLNRKKANVILLSDYLQKDFLNAVSFKGKSFVLNNFVDERFFHTSPETQRASLKQLRLIAVGTLQPLKNFHYLLEVFKVLKEYDISLDIYGKGDKSSYVNIIQSNQLKVRLMGHLMDVQPVLSNYDLFIMPSKYEGSPLAVFEAMAAGLPVMLSDIGPLRSAAGDNALYFPLDNAESVAVTLKGLLDDQERLAPMAARAKTYAATKARRATYIRSLLDIYAQL